MDDRKDCNREDRRRLMILIRWLDPAVDEECLLGNFGLGATIWLLLILLHHRLWFACRRELVDL